MLHSPGEQLLAAIIQGGFSYFLLLGFFTLPAAAEGGLSSFMLPVFLVFKISLIVRKE